MTSGEQKRMSGGSEARRARTVWSVMAAAVLVGGVLFGRPQHPHFWWDALPGFYAAFGLAGCWLLGAALKALGKRWLQRPVDYYDH